MPQGTVDSRRGESVKIIVRRQRAGTLHVRRAANLGLAAEAMISAFYILRKVPLLCTLQCRSFLMDSLHGHIEDSSIL